MMSDLFAALGGVVGLVLLLFLTVLSILMPFFVLRINHWTYRLYQELKNLNESGMTNILEILCEVYPDQVKAIQNRRQQV